jgi:hypothetical protein
MSTASWARCTARPTALTVTRGTTPTMPRTLDRTCSGRPLCRERERHTQRESRTQRERERRTHIRTQMHMRTRTHIHAYAHMHTCVRAHTHTCMRTHTYTHVVWVVPLRLSTMSHGALMRMTETQRRCQWRPPSLPQTLPGCPRHSARARDRPMAEPRPYMGAQSDAPLSLPRPNPDRGDRHQCTTCDTAPSFTVAAGLIIRAGAVLTPLCATVCLARTPRGGEEESGPCCKPPRLQRAACVSAPYPLASAAAHWRCAVAAPLADVVDASVTSSTPARDRRAPAAAIGACGCKRSGRGLGG